VLVEHARAIAAFADPEKKGPTLPVPLQLLLAAAQVTRDTGRKTFSPGELSKRLSCSQQEWLIAYRKQLFILSQNKSEATLDTKQFYASWFKLQGLTSLQLTQTAAESAKLLMPLTNPK
jgi:hypothetical protein